MLSHVIEAVVRNIENYTIEDGVGKIGVLKITGPDAYTLAIEKYINEYPDTPYTFLSPNSRGVRYSAFDVATMEHEGMYGSVHYSRLTEPIVLPRQKIDKRMPP